MRNFVVLEFEFDSVCFEFLLCNDKIFAICPKRQMKHSNFAVRGRFRFLVRGEQGDPGISLADKGWHAIPHAIMKPLEPENVDLPFGGSFNVAHAHGYVINAFELHEMLDRIYRTTKTIKVERVVLNALASAVGRVSSLIPVVASSDENCAFGDFSHRLRRSRPTTPILAACESR